MPSRVETNVDGENRTLELYVRSLAPRASHDRQEEVVTQLEQLETEGQIREYEVHVWGSRVDLSSRAAETDTGRFVRERVESFTKWTANNGLSTEPFFEAESVDCSITGEEFDAVTLPKATLAEYVDGELDFVTPCTDGETVLSVTDRLRELEERNRAPNTVQPI
jgi:hypothetical protein